MIHSRVRTSFQHRWFIPELELHFSISIWRPSRADHLRGPSYRISPPTDWPSLLIPFKPSCFRHIIIQRLYPFHHYIFQLLALLTCRWPLVYFLPHLHVRPIVSKQFFAVLSLFKLAFILSFWSISPFICPFSGPSNPPFFQSLNAFLNLFL